MDKIITARRTYNGYEHVWINGELVFMHPATYSPPGPTQRQVSYEVDLFCRGVTAALVKAGYKALDDGDTWTKES